MTTRQGSTGNVIAALCSFLLPGLGQVLQGRLGMAAFLFVLNIALWTITLGWIIHIWAAVDAALFNPKIKKCCQQHEDPGSH